MDAADYNFVSSIGVFASTSKTGEVVEARDYVLANTRAPIAEFNQVDLDLPAGEPGRALFHHRQHAFARVLGGEGDALLQ
jgi:hypothetical protein